MRGCQLLVSILVFSLLSVAHAASSADLRAAKKLYERMTGVKVPGNKAELLKVADFLAAGKKLEAARYITSTPDFLNVQIRNLSLRMSNKDESVKVPFNDFSALIVGVVKDDRDFREILTADYYYDVVGSANDDDQRTRFFNQGNFTPVETGFMDLTKVLKFQPRQKLVTAAFDTSFLQKQKSYALINLADHPEPAGVLTTRTFAERNLSGGTNRRAVEFSLKQFLCVSMAEAADSSASDQYVGRDVERFPAGDYNKYLTSCKSCHSVMDAMRPAFAKLDFDNFTNSAATGVYSQMHGEFFRDQKIADDYAKYVAEVVNPAIAAIVPDVEQNQENSIYYKTRYDFMISQGTAAAAAKSTLDGVLNTIRDPKIVVQLIGDFRLKKAALLSDLRAKRSNTDYQTLYGKTCLDHLGNTTLSAQAQEEKFLQCNLDVKKDLSLIYTYYGEDLKSKGTSDSESNRLLGKLINKGRATNGNFIIAYLQAKEQSKLFARNAFDSSTGISTKMNKGSYPYGFVVQSDTFVNNAILGSKMTFFGWRGANKLGGNGTKDFGRMLSESRRFSQCMAKKVYENVCMKKLTETQYTTMIRLGDRFEALNYNLKGLYQEVALDPVCGVLSGE